MRENGTTWSVAVSLVLGIGLALGLLYVLSAQASPVRAATGAGDAQGMVGAAAAASDVITVCLSGACDFDTVQAAVDAADDGDEILVASGTYTGVSARAGVTQVVYISKSVALRGGYTITNWHTPHPMSTPTTLDAEGQGRVLYIVGEVSPTVEGLRITGGSAEGLGGGPSGQDVGGGVYVDGAAATISGCQVVSNTARWGGGLYLLDSSAIVLSNRIEANEGLPVDSRGGGVYVREGATLLEGNTIALHQAHWDWGSGIYLYGSDATLRANRVTENVARIGGGGAHAWGGAPLLLDNVFTANAAEWGGGVNLDRSDGAIAGNDVLSNTASFGGGGMCFGGSSASLSRNTVRSNRAAFGAGVYLNGAAFEFTDSAIVGNQASDSGGGFFLYAANVTLTNAMVLDNWAGTSGGGIQSWAGSVRLLHTTIARNKSLDDGSGVYLLGGGSAALTNTILVSHSVGIHANGDTAVSLNSTLWGSGAWANGVDWSGSGSIAHTRDYWGDPAFVDPDAGDYHVRPSSAALDQGIDAGASRDADGDPRPLPVGGGFDLGADEYAEINLTVSEKAVHPEQAAAGDVLTYTILLLNEGNMRSQDTLLVDSLPTQTTYISGSATTSAGVLTGGDAIRWSGTLTPHHPVTVTFAVTLGETSLVRNTAVVTDEKGGVTTLWTLVNGLRLYLPLIAR